MKKENTLLIAMSFFKTGIKNALLHFCIIGLLLSVMSLSAHATPISVTITVDNSYALFFGTETGATDFVGADYDWRTTETYTFDLASDRYIYVVTASDLLSAQGFLGQFENLDTGYKFYSSDPQWEVMATGLGSGAPYSGSSSDLALLTQEILDANAGGNASSGWTGLTAGPANGSTPWRLSSGIDAAAQWVWYSSNGDTDPTTPGYNHDEWLVFRIAVESTPVSEPVPEPGTMILLGVGLIGLAGLRKKINIRTIS